MSNFKIEIEGLKELKASLTSNATQFAIPDVTIAVLKFNNVLDRRVNAVFNVKNSIETVRVGKSVKPQAVGNSLLLHSLQYRDKPVPLAEYSPIESPNTSAISSAPLRKRNGMVKWTKGKWSKDVTVQVRRGKKTISHRGNNYRLKGFLIPGSKHVFAREGRKTWDVLPTQGVQGTRAPYSMLFGPSLATLVNTVYNKDKEVAVAREIMTDEIVNAIVKGYTR